MRTLQRAYAREFGQSMSQTLIDARLEHAKALLTMMPPTKISVVANTLGVRRAAGLSLPLREVHA